MTRASKRDDRQRDWTRARDLRAQVQKSWDRGELLACLVMGESLFPRRLSLRTPTSQEIAGHFDEVRAWVAELRDARHFRFVDREFNHRVFGANAIPAQAWIDHAEDALSLLGKRAEAARFEALIDITRQRDPVLLPWLARNSLQALEIEQAWSRLLDVVAWIRTHPRPNIYLRQIDIPGVHTKFIESHRGVLTELLDLALPADAVNCAAAGVSQFGKRFGFRDKPLRVRFRGRASPFRDADITLDAPTFASLEPSVSHVFITENETNFLSFPDVVGSTIIFGAGYGFELLRQAQWLRRCRIHYWGDIDTHGFAILDQLRGVLGDVESFLMDHETLFAFETQWGNEEIQLVRDLPRLHSHERRLYDDLRDNRIRKNLRLEQERIGFDWLQTALARLYA
jgi:hypothetical protein